MCATALLGFRPPLVSRGSRCGSAGHRGAVGQLRKIGLRRNAEAAPLPPPQQQQQRGAPPPSAQWQAQDPFKTVHSNDLGRLWLLRKFASFCAFLYFAYICGDPLAATVNVLIGLFCLFF